MKNQDAKIYYENKLLFQGDLEEINTAIRQLFCTGKIRNTGLRFYMENGIYTEFRKLLKSAFKAHSDFEIHAYLYAILCEKLQGFGIVRGQIKIKESGRSFRPDISIFSYTGQLKALIEVKRGSSSYGQEADEHVVKLKEAYKVPLFRVKGAEEIWNSLDSLVEDLRAILQSPNQ